MNRRGFLTGLVALVAAPAIVRPEALMRVVCLPLQEPGWQESAEWFDPRHLEGYFDIYVRPTRTIEYIRMNRVVRKNGPPTDEIIETLFSNRAYFFACRPCSGEIIQPDDHLGSTA